MKALYFATIMLLAACDDDIVDGSVDARVRGHVISGSGAVANARLSATVTDPAYEGIMAAECGTVSDSVGAFDLLCVVFLGAPFSGSMVLTVTPPAMSDLRDTTLALAVPFAWPAPVTELEIELSPAVDPAAIRLSNKRMQPTAPSSWSGPGAVWAWPE